MPYSVEINRSNPSCFLFLIDQSGSMCEVMNPTNIQLHEKPIVVDGKTYTHGAQGQTKAQVVSDVLNRLFRDLILKCAKEEGIRDYFHIGAIGYGGDNTDRGVHSAFGSRFGNRYLIPISEIENNPLRIEERTKKVSDGVGGLIDQKTKFPIYFEPVTSQGTPMCSALRLARTIVLDWLGMHPRCFPPIVINITDGESTDGDPLLVADALKNLASSDGNVLLFNIHISTTKWDPIRFPDSETNLPDRFARQLFRMSSILTPNMQSMARLDGFRMTDYSRGFVFNADTVELIRFLEIGTRASNLR